MFKIWEQLLTSFLLVLGDQWTLDNSQNTKFSFTHARKLAVVLRATYWSNWPYMAQLYEAKVAAAVYVSWLFISDIEWQMVYSMM